MPSPSPRSLTLSPSRHRQPVQVTVALNLDPPKPFDSGFRSDFDFARVDHEFR